MIEEDEGGLATDVEYNQVFIALDAKSDSIGLKKIKKQKTKNQKKKPKQTQRRKAIRKKSDLRSEMKRKKSQSTHAHMYSD